MSELPAIDSDVPCAACGYNLRGLVFDGRCPECGIDIIHSLRPFLKTRDAERAKWLEDVSLELRKRKFRSIAEAGGFSVDAAMFVWDAWNFAWANNLAPKSAAAVCDVIRDYADTYFNDRAEAVELLSEWGIHRSEDVGSIVYAFVAAGWLKAEAGDSIQDFNGLFTLESWFSQDDV
jgi:uncharacterized repeat protein (TIGR04138 family)